MTSPSWTTIAPIGISPAARAFSAIAMAAAMNSESSVSWVSVEVMSALREQENRSKRGHDRVFHTSVRYRCSLPGLAEFTAVRWKTRSCPPTRGSANGAGNYTVA